MTKQKSKKKEGVPYQPARRSFPKRDRTGTLHIAPLLKFIKFPNCESFKQQCETISIFKGRGNQLLLRLYLIDQPIFGSPKIMSPHRIHKYYNVFERLHREMTDVLHLRKPHKKCFDL
jgi:hypothetical protein